MCEQWSIQARATTAFKLLVSLSNAEASFFLKVAEKEVRTHCAGGTWGHRKAEVSLDAAQDASFVAQ